MIIAKPTTLACITCLLVVLSSVILLAQSELQYSGSLQVGKYKGTAEFTYKIVAGDTVLNGPFRMKHSSLGSLIAEGDHFFSFKGTFDENLPDGSWQFQFGDFQIGEDATELVDYHYQVNISGIQHVATGSMDGGKPDSEWIHTVQRIDNSEVAETIFKSNIQFEDGIPQQSFRIENQYMTLLGRFLRDGLAHDVWELYADTVTGVLENWHFMNGRLEKIQIQQNGQTETLQAYPNEIDNFKVINLDDRYIQIIKLNQQLANRSDARLKGSINELLTANAEYYKKIDGILSKLGDTTFMPEFKVKVAHFPLDKKELQQLDSIDAYHIKAETVSRQLIKNTQLNIIKLSEEDVFFLLSVVEEIRKNYLPPIKETLNYHEQSVLDYVSRENLLETLWSDGKASTSIKVNYNSEKNESKTFVGPKANEFNFDNDGIDAVYQLARYSWLSIDSIEHVLNEKLRNKERQEELELLEEQLITAMTQLNELTDSLLNEVSGEPAKALQSLKSTANRELSSYSAIEDMTVKPERARLLIECFGDMNELAEAISLLPPRWDEIRMAYIDEVWNPFTSTLMNEQVKKRITDAYQKDLVPYFLNQINNELSCENAGNLSVQLNTAYKRMLEMREEDTGRIEGKLKKEQDPEMVMQLFNIPSKNEIE